MVADAPHDSVLSSVVGDEDAKRVPSIIVH